MTASRYFDEHGLDINHISLVVNRLLATVPWIEFIPAIPFHAISLLTGMSKLYNPIPISLSLPNHQSLIITL
jgi:hypothetical protein